MDKKEWVKGNVRNVERKEWLKNGNMGKSGSKDGNGNGNG